MGEVLSAISEADFARILREHAPSMRARLRKLGLSAADIDDCIQDAFVKAWRLRDQMPSNPKRRSAWFGLLAFNASCRRRRELRRAHYVGQSDELAELAGESRSNPEIGAMLAEVLDRLPAQYREIVRLRAHEYTIKDIAEHYGIPWTTAQSRWERACVAMGARER